MANNYIEWAVTVPMKTPDAVMQAALDCQRLADIDDEVMFPAGAPTKVCEILDGYAPSWEADADCETVSMTLSSENGDTQAAAHLIHHWMQQGLVDGQFVSIEGCWRCDKLRPGEFGGYAYFITPKEVRLIELRCK